MNISGSQPTLSFTQEVLESHFPDHSNLFLKNVFQAIEDLFSGRYPGYQKSDTAYHDLAHTCEATVAVVRILDGHLKGGTPPALEARDFELAVATTLLHDSGFVKESDDLEGSGAKYTLTHVVRSGDFAEKCLPNLGVTADEIRLVKLAIDCTGVAVDVSALPFSNDRERFLGCVIGTGDILGQMAAPNYPERLPGLYSEFAEAANHSKDSWIASYASARDLMEKTRVFYEGYVKSMLDGQWEQAHKALHHHFEDGKNHYLESIEANIDRIEAQLHIAETH